MRGRRVMRRVTGIKPSGEVHRLSGRDYPIYEFDCGHTRKCLRIDGIVTAFLFNRAEAGEAEYPMRKCYDCSWIATKAS